MTFLLSLMDQETFVRALLEYTELGGRDALVRFKDLCESYTTADVLVADLHGNAPLEACVRKLIGAVCAKRPDLDGWACLRFLMDYSRHAGAPRLLVELPDYPQRANERLLIRISSVLSGGTSEHILYQSLNCLSRYLTSGSVHYQIVNSNNAALPKALLNYIQGPFLEAPAHYQGTAMTSVIGLLRRSRGSGGSAWDALPSLKLGALHIITAGALHMWQTGDDKRASLGLRAVRSVVGQIVDLIPEGLALLDCSMYQLSRNDNFKLTIMVYHNLSTKDETQLEYGSVAIDSLIVGKYLHAHGGADALQSFLLYRPPRDCAGKRLLEKLTEASRRSGEVKTEASINTWLQKRAAELPQVAAVLESIAPPEAPAERAVKDRHCAYPGCTITGEGCFNNMKKCGRCLMVYYCCQAHQQQHWHNGHRGECIKK